MSEKTRTQEDTLFRKMLACVGLALGDSVLMVGLMDLEDTGQSIVRIRQAFAVCWPAIKQGKRLLARKVFSHVLTIEEQRQLQKAIDQALGIYPLLQNEVCGSEEKTELSNVVHMNHRRTQDHPEEERANVPEYIHFLVELFREAHACGDLKLAVREYILKLMYTDAGLSVLANSPSVAGAFGELLALLDVAIMTLEDEGLELRLELVPCRETQED